MFKTAKIVLPIRSAKYCRKKVMHMPHNNIRDKPGYPSEPVISLIEQSATKKNDKFPGYDEKSTLHHIFGCDRT